MNVDAILIEGLSKVKISVSASFSPYLSETGIHIQVLFAGLVSACGAAGDGCWQ